jgi:hypothetical protein
MSLVRRWWVAALVPVALLVAGALPSSGCSGSTGDERFAFTASIGGAARAGSGPLTFTNEQGWEVRLDRAMVFLGPLYLNTVPPLAETAWFSLVRPAFADPSHLAPGRITGELLGQLSFDALSPDLVPFAETGTLTREPVRTLELRFYPPAGVSFDTLKITDPVVEVAGLATRGADAVPFRGALVLDDTWIPDIQAGDKGGLTIAEIREVRGVPADFHPEPGGTLEIRLDPAQLLRGADFSSLASNPLDQDGTTRLLVQARTGAHTTDQVMRGMFNAIRASTGTYQAQWRPAGG